MAWEPVTWACGHAGFMQLRGPQSGRDATVAYESGRQCMACWLVEQWEADDDSRAKREDRFVLAAAIAKAKGKDIQVPACVPVRENMASLQAEREMLLGRLVEIDAILKPKT